MLISNHKIAMISTLMLGLTAATFSHAQKANVGLTTGLTGTNIEVSKSLNDYVSVRADMYVSGSLNRTLTLEGNSYGLAFTPDTKSLLIDVHPFSGAFYLTGGLVQQNINFKLTGKPSGGNYTFNNTSYAASSVGTFTGTAGFSKSTAPYVGMGWSNRNSSASGLAFSFEAGIIDVGTGKASLSVACGSGLPSVQCKALQTDVTAEASKVNNKLNQKLYYPVAKLGISYRF